MSQLGASRYALLAPGGDPELAAKYDRVGGTESNVAGILHWLSKSPPQS